MSDSISRLHAAVIAARDADPAYSRTARLMQAGRGKMAKKLAEEAVEVVIDAMQGDTEAVIRESADLLYNLVVLWVAAGVRPHDVWREMGRREGLFGIAEKLPKPAEGKVAETITAASSRKSAGKSPGPNKPRVKGAVQPMARARAGSKRRVAALAIREPRKRR